VRVMTDDGTKNELAERGGGTLETSGGGALRLDRDARPLPPWKQQPELSPRSGGWRSGAGAASMQAWRAAYEAMPPDEQAAYQRRYPAPIYWFWFWSEPGLARTVTIWATFPLWMLLWALAKTLGGAAGRANG